MSFKSYFKCFTVVLGVAVLPAAFADSAMVPCPFDTNLSCTLFHDILNDVDTAGLRYYGPTNYDHRFSGEIEIFDSNLVQPYTDGVNAPGQIKLTANLTNGLWKSGEIMTRVNLDQPPYKSPKKIHPFTTNDIQHGYVEVKLRTPRCEVSDDGKCQAGTNPPEYSRGLWPSVWMLPTHDTNWPQNGEIDIWEAYQKSQPLTTSTSALHFNGNGPGCGNNDCKFIGYHLPGGVAKDGNLWNSFHTWGFEWQPDPASTKGGVILTEYFDGMKLWGPLKTDSLPGDGPNAFSRGFHDPNGGFYLIAAVAVGGGYAGAPNSHMRSATMYIQSIKAYTVGGSNPQQGDLTLNFAAGTPSQCNGATDVLNIGANDHPSFTIGTTPFKYKMNVGSYAVSLKSSSTPLPVTGGTCKGTLSAAQTNVPGQVTATYTFTATPATDKGTIALKPSASSDPKCNNASDTLFLDQETTGSQFTVLSGISKSVNVGAHKLKLASQTSIPASPGFCTSTLSNSEVNVAKDQTSSVTATYAYHENNTGQSCTVTSAKVVQQADWGTGIVNTFQINVTLNNFPADTTGKMVLNGALLMKNNFKQNFWGNFSMTSYVNQNNGTFTGEAWSTQLSFGGFIDNANPMKIGDNPLQKITINDVVCS